MCTHFFWDHGSDHGVCDHDLKKEIKVIAKLLSLFSANVFRHNIWHEGSSYTSAIATNRLNYM